MKKTIVGWAVTVLTCMNWAVAADWITLDMPGAANSSVEGIDGDNIVGYYDNGDRSATHGFIYNITANTWTTLDMPSATSTFLTGIDKGVIVGNYDMNNNPEIKHGCVYNRTIWTPLDMPGSAYTWIAGIDGDNMVGIGMDSSGRFPSFIYNKCSWSYYGITPWNNDWPEGISGNNIVGTVYNTNNPESCHYDGYLYDGFLYYYFNIYPFDLSISTYFQGIDGDMIVGYYQEQTTFHGVLYNIVTQEWTVLDKPGAVNTWITDIDGSNVIGYYKDSSGVYHNFLYTIPEPASAVLMLLGAAWMGARRRR
jgi:hypothetical protein